MSSLFYILAIFLNQYLILTLNHICIYGLEVNERESTGVLPYFTNWEAMSPQIISISSGNTVDLSCHSKGWPKPTIKWYKNNKLLNESYRENLESLIQKKWFIRMKNMSPSDDGNYTCVVSNKLGQISHTYYVEVIDFLAHRPVFDKHIYPLNQTLKIGETARFDCIYISDVDSTVNWIGSVTKGNITQNIDISDLENKYFGTDWNNLVINNLTIDDSGNYSCFIKNYYGFNFKNFSLKVISDESLFDDYLENTLIYTTIGLLVVVIIALTIAVIVRSMKKNITIKAEKSFIIIKKKITLESSESQKSNELVAPYVQIENQTTQVLYTQWKQFLGFSEQIYEIPLDPEWEVNRQNIKLGKILGEGAFGQVVKAEAIGLNNSNGLITTVAVKMLKDIHNDIELKALISELEIMKRMGKHINIINLLGASTQNGPLYVITEYAPNGNLKDYLRKHRPNSIIYYNEEAIEKHSTMRGLTYYDLINYAFQIARGMEYLSSKRFVHRDLATRNVLVSDNNVLKICDFGLTRTTNGEYYRKTTDGRLPIKWMAIESIAQQIYTTQTDVWSYGILLWEIMSFGETPYPGITGEELSKRLANGYRMEAPDNCPKNIYELMTNCWKVEPHQRPTFTELVELLDKLLDINSTKEYLNLNEINSIQSLLTSQSTKASFQSLAYNLDKGDKESIRREQEIIFQQNIANKGYDMYLNSKFKKSKFLSDSQLFRGVYISCDNL